MSQQNMMPLFTDAYLADTTHLTLEEHGAYLKLLMVMWRNGGWLPNDDEKVARYLGITEKKWEKLKPVIGDFFTYEDDRFTQKKLKKIFSGKQEATKENRENGRKGGIAKAQKNNNTDLANATISPENNCSEILAHQTPHQVPSKTPPYPRPVDNPENGVGVFKNGEAGRKSFDIERLLSDSGRAAAKLAAPGWDIYYIMRIYNQGVIGGERDPPHHPDQAFPEWCKRYTKGKNP